MVRSISSLCIEESQLRPSRVDKAVPATGVINNSPCMSFPFFPSHNLGDKHGYPLVKGHCIHIKRARGSTVATLACQRWGLVEHCSSTDPGSIPTGAG